MPASRGCLFLPGNRSDALAIHSKILWSRCFALISTHCSKEAAASHCSRRLTKDTLLTQRLKHIGKAFAGFLEPGKAQGGNYHGGKIAVEYEQQIQFP